MDSKTQFVLAILVRTNFWTVLILVTRQVTKISTRLKLIRLRYLFQMQGTLVGFIFFQKNFQNRAFFGIYGPKSADVSTFFGYTLRENRFTYGPGIFTQAINQ